MWTSGQGVSITANIVDVEVFSFAPQAVWTLGCIRFHRQHCRSAGCIPFHRLQCGCAGCINILYCTVDVQGESIYTIIMQCGRSGCIHRHCKQCIHAGCIYFHRQQYRGAGCILLHLCTMFFNARGYGIHSVRYQYALKCRCREQPSTGIRSIEMAVYWTGVDHGLLDL